MGAREYGVVLTMPSNITEGGSSLICRGEACFLNLHSALQGGHLVVALKAALSSQFKERGKQPCQRQ